MLLLTGPQHITAVLYTYRISPSLGKTRVEEPGTFQSAVSQQQAISTGQQPTTTNSNQHQSPAEMDIEVAQRVRAILAAVPPLVTTVDASGDYVVLRYPMPAMKFRSAQGKKNPDDPGGKFYQLDSKRQSRANFFRKKGQTEEADRVASSALVSDEQAARTCCEEGILCYKNYEEGTGALVFNGKFTTGAKYEEAAKSLVRQHAQPQGRGKGRFINFVLPLRQPGSAGGAHGAAAPAPAPVPAADEEEAEWRQLHDQQDTEYAAAEAADRARFAAAEAADRARREADQTIMNSDLEVARTARLRRFISRRPEPDSAPVSAAEEPSQRTRPVRQRRKRMRYVEEEMSGTFLGGSVAKYRKLKGD